MKYPDFCCQCCGYTNGDMYIDWFFEKHGRWPDKGDWVEYWRYRSSNYESLYKELKSRIKSEKNERRKRGAKNET